MLDGREHYMVTVQVPGQGRYLLGYASDAAALARYTDIADLKEEEG